MKKLYVLIFLLFSMLGYGQNLRTAHHYTVKLNDTINVQFPANQSTGFQWRLLKRDGVCVDSLAYAYRLFTAGFHALGGVETWQFRAVSMGIARYSFCYQHPCKKNPPIVKDVTIEVCP